MSAKRPISKRNGTVTKTEKSPIAVGVAAERGDVIVQEVEHTKIRANGDRLIRKREYSLAVVARVTSDGHVKTYRQLGDPVIRTLTPCKVFVVAAARLDVPALESAYHARNKPFRSLKAACEFIRPHLRSPP